MKLTPLDKVMPPSLESSYDPKYKLADVLSYGLL